MIINNGGYYTGITPGISQIPSGQIPLKTGIVQNEPQTPTGEEVVLSEKAQHARKKETGISQDISKQKENREALPESSSRGSKGSPREAGAGKGVQYADTTTGQTFMLSGSSNGSGLAILSNEAGARNTGGVSGKYHFSPSMATAARQKLETVMEECSWCVFKGNNGVTPTGKNDSIKVPDWEQAEPMMISLAADPAKGGKMTPGSVEEAAVGIYAGLAGIAAPPVSREETGAAEFVDGNSVKWDVKSPKSPPPGAKWTFDAEHQLVKIRHDQSNGEVVMLNLSECTAADTRQLIDLINKDMTDKERENIVVLMRNEALQ
ncbi:MAG: hypothetical protein AB9903_22415 [Vulcanimicrobiota bacterium]